jgi:hypothetical protein
MPTRIRKRSDEADISRSGGVGSVEMSFDVVEWLDGERLEHERRMQELGCPCKSTEGLSEFPDKQRGRSARR